MFDQPGSASGFSVAGRSPGRIATAHPREASFRRSRAAQRGRRRALDLDAPGPASVLARTTARLDEREPTWTSPLRARSRRGTASSQRAGSARGAVEHDSRSGPRARGRRRPGCGTLDHPPEAITVASARPGDGPRASAQARRDAVGRRADPDARSRGRGLGGGVRAGSPSARGQPERLDLARGRSPRRSSRPIRWIAASPGCDAISRQVQAFEMSSSETRNPWSFSSRRSSSSRSPSRGRGAPAARLRDRAVASRALAAARSACREDLARAGDPRSSAAAARLSSREILGARSSAGRAHPRDVLLERRRDRLRAPGPAFPTRRRRVV